MTKGIPRVTEGYVLHFIFCNEKINHIFHFNLKLTSQFITELILQLNHLHTPAVVFKALIPKIIKVPDLY